MTAIIETLSEFFAGTFVTTLQKRLFLSTSTC